MVIANYSPQHGVTGATSNMVAIVSILALKHDQNILVLQNHFKMNNLESTLVKEQKQGLEIDPNDDYGMDSLIRNRKAAQMDKKMLEYSCHTLLDGKIHLLPATRKVSEEVYEKESGILLEILDMARNEYDHIFIDLNSGERESTNRILERADLVLINLSQNKQVMESYKANKKGEDGKKIYLIGNYDSRSKCNISNMRYLYPDLEKKITFPIEYCVGYKDAIWDSTALKFFRKNVDVKPKTKNYQFIKSVKDIASYIMEREG